MAPYFVQLRETERRMINGALEHATDELGSDSTFEDRAKYAAGLLGIHATYIRVRTRVLGGIAPGDPRHEPPDLSPTEVWKQETTRSPEKPKPKPKPPKLQIVKEAEPDA
jgi:hypothetical protein